MESIDTHTPSGRMFIKIIGIFAEFERENIIERVSVALEKKAREGYILPIFNVVPYGYSREIGQREITVSEEESKIVREIFNLYLHKHKSFNAIATELNMRNIPSSASATWSGSGIRYILSNPLYMGKVRYSVKDEKRYFEAEGKHEAIILEKTFLEVQIKMQKMQKIAKKRPMEDNYFCGTLYCAVCGRKMTTHGGKPKNSETYYGNYTCSGKADCTTVHFSHKKVEAAFRKYIEGYEDLEVDGKEIIASQGYDTSSSAEGLKAELKITLNKLIKKERDIMSLYISDKIDYEDYTKMLSLIKTERKAHEVKIAELEDTVQIDTEFQIGDILSNFNANWELLTRLERMQFLQTYVQAIYIAKEQGEGSPSKPQVKVKRLEFYKR